MECQNFLSHNFLHGGGGLQSLYGKGDSEACMMKKGPAAEQLGKKITN